MPIDGPDGMELVVECDGCGEEEDMEATQFAGDLPSWGVTAETLEEHGWTADGGEVYCPKCSKEGG